MPSPNRSVHTPLLLAALLGAAVVWTFVCAPARADPLDEQLAGKWQRGKADEMLGVEFDGKGGCKMYRPRRLPLSGKYRIPVAGSIELQFDGQDSKETLKVKVAGDRATFKDGDSEPVVWTHVETFAEPINHPNGKPNADQKQWLVGSWFTASEDAFGLAQPRLFDFASDGTFLRVEALPVGHTVAVGTYEVHPKADNFVLLTYADTGRTEALYAEMTKDALGLIETAKLGREVIQFERRKWERPRAEKVKDAPAQAFDFYRLCTADTEAAEKKFADKDVTVAGFVTGFGIKSGEFAVLRLCTGDSARLVCGFDLTNKADEAKLRKIVKPLTTPWVVVKGRWAKASKEKDPNTAAFGGLGVIQPKVDGPVWLLHLERCELLEGSPLTTPEK